MQNSEVEISVYFDLYIPVWKIIKLKVVYANFNCFIILWTNRMCLGTKMVNGNNTPLPSAGLGQ